MSRLVVVSNRVLDLGKAARADSSIPKLSNSDAVSAALALVLACI
jgi:hypothetical protein